MQSLDRLKPASGLRLNRELLSQLSDSPASVAVVLGLSAGLGWVIVTQAWILSQAVTALFLPSDASPHLTSWLWQLVLLAVLRGGLLWARGWSAGRGSARSLIQVRQRAVDGLLSGGPALVGGRPTGEWTASLIDGVDSLDSYFRLYLPALATAAVIPLAIAAVVLALDPVSGLILLVTAPTVPFFMILIGRTANRQLLARWDQLRRMSGHFLKVVQGLPTIRLFGRTAKEANRIRSISDQFRQSTLAVLRVAFLSALVLEWAAMLSTAVIAVEIGLRLLSGNLSFQTGFFILLLTPEFFIPLRSVGARFHDAAGGAIAATTALQLAGLAGPDGSNSVPSGPASEFPAQAAEVRFEHVSYTYPGRDRPALEDVSFCVHPGERLLVLGPSGAGKSTLGLLVLGLLQPSSGTLQIGGVTVSSSADEPPIASVSWVPQSPYFFSGTIADNLRFARPGASLAELARAVTLADAAGFITDLPAGFQTEIGERAVRLSAGQAQRLAIARAFLVDAPVLLLDEPTAHLDGRAAAAIQRTLDHLMRGRTTILISHRLHGLSGADQVLVLAGGRMQALADPREVIRSSNPIWRLITSADLGPND